MNAQKGLVCSLTGEHATFQNECSEFIIDEKEAAYTRERIEKTEVEENQPLMVIDELDPKILARFRESQDYLYAILGGLAAALICAALWAVITVATEYQIGFMAIGVGLAAGFAVRYFGAGVDKPFGIIGAVSALLGCFLGNLFTQIWFIAEYQSINFINAFRLLDIASMSAIIAETFSGMDLIFYGIAAYEGYKFAFRNISIHEIEKIQSSPDYIPVPANQQFRMPAVIGTFIFLSVAYFSLSGKVSGMQQYFHENGNVMHEGELLEGRLNGTWKYYDMAGNLSLVGDYSDDLEEGEWTWYANNRITKKGNYEKGIAHGIWINYYEDGVLADSGNYNNGRREGYWVRKYPNGNLLNEGVIEREKQNGEWKIYHDNGKLAAVLNYKQGQLSGKGKYWHSNDQMAKEVDFDEKQNEKIMYSWDMNGKPLVINGNGIHREYYDNSNFSQEGEIKNGYKTGKWQFFYQDGKIHSSGTYDKDQIFVLSNYNNEEGQEIIRKGNGEVEKLILNDVSYESGKFENGYREGLWYTYDTESDIILAETNYKAGKMDGTFNTYFNLGNKQTEGFYSMNERAGIWSWYYENGQLESTVLYIDGKKDGDQEFYNELGTLVRIEEYVNGELQF